MIAQSKPNAQTISAHTPDADGKWLYRVGGISALVLGAAYLATMVLYVPIGAPPAGAEARLAYVAGNTAAWWGILALSVLTDFLFIPVALALYLALRGIHRNMMLVATSFVLLFAVLDLAVTWTNYAALIVLGGDYAAANEAQRALLVAAARYPTAVLESPLLGVYAILIPAIGIFLSSLVMLKGIFNKATAYVGLLTGILALVSVMGPFISGGLGIVIIFASLLTTLWVLLVGYQLFRIGQA